MPETSEQLLWMILRSSTLLAVLCVLVEVLLKQLNVQSDRIHALAWSAVIAQGLILIPFRMEVPILVTADTPQTAIDDSSIESKALNFVVDQETAYNQPAIVQRTAPAPVAVPPAEIQPWLNTGILVVSGWLAGVLVTVSWLGFDYLRFIRTLPAVSAVDEKWQLQCDSIREHVQFRKVVQLAVTEGFGPAVCWAPGGYRLLVPGHQWSTLSAAQRELVLRHELAHLQRHDLWKTLFFHCVACLHWFNPFAWLAVRRIAECAEWSCDEIVRRSSELPTTEYVRALLEFSVPRHRIPHLIPTAAGHSLVRRTQRLLTPKLKEDSEMKKLVVTLIVATAAVTGGLNFDLVAQQKRAVIDESSTPVTDSVLIEDNGEVRLIAADVVPEARPFSIIESNWPVHLIFTATGLLDDVSPAPTVRLVTDDDGTKVTSRPNAVDLVSGSQHDRLGTKEAVIDISHVFQNLPEFNRMKESIQKDLKVHEAQMRAEAMSVQRLSEKVKSATGSDQAALLAELNERKAKLGTDRQVVRQQLGVDEAKMYAVVFRKVRKAIADHAREHDIHIVRRASIGREQQKKLESGDPRAVILAMNEQVLYIADDSIDITDAVLARLQSQPEAAKSAGEN